MVKITERTVRDEWRRSNGYKETQDRFRINVFPLEREPAGIEQNIPNTMSVTLIPGIFCDSVLIRRWVLTYAAHIMIVVRHSERGITGRDESASYLPNQSTSH
jgi:hypothetical protein